MRRWLLVALALLAAQSLQAQGSCTTSGVGSSGTTRSCNFTRSAPNPTSYTNPMLLELNVSGSTSNGAMTLADYESGRSPSMAMTLFVRGNRTWVVTASGPATWTGVGPVARQNKPVSDLRWSLSTTGSGTPLSVTPATVFSGNPGSGVSRTLFWFTQLSWNGDPPGAYNIEVTLTLTAP